MAGGKTHSLHFQRPRYFVGVSDALEVPGINKKSIAACSWNDALDACLASGVAGQGVTKQDYGPTAQRVDLQVPQRSGRTSML